MNRTSKRMLRLKEELPFHLLLLPGVVFIAIYHYGPLAGLTMAFQKFQPIAGFFHSKWVGMKNFEYIFNLPDFSQVFWNTLEIAVLKIVFGLAVPLLLALLLNEATKSWFVRSVQTSVFLPFFLSWTILGGVLFELFSFKGPINALFAWLGLDSVLFMGDAGWFRAILVGSDVWKGMGYNMIIFLASIAGINQNLYEAAQVDGAGRWKQAIHVTLPGMAPMIILISTLSIGGILNAGFEQVLVLYNPTVYSSADVIDTFVYRLGLFDQQYSPAAAIGLFKSVISLFLVSLSYYLAYRFSKYRIF